MFVMEVPFLDLDQIYKSGQCPRWIRLREGKYVVQDGNKALKVEQQKGRLIMSCSEEDFYEIWFKYFDLSTDYAHPFYALGRNEMFLKICAVRGNGVRILRQDLFESIITSTIASWCDMNITQHAVQMLNIICGVKRVQAMREAGRITWYEFPAPEAILENKDKLDMKYFGFLKEKILDVCQDIVDGWLDLDLLRAMSYVDAKDYLLQFESFDAGAADRICLYGLHHLCAFPENETVENAIARELDCDVETFTSWFLGDLNGYEGVMYQHILHNELNPPKNGDWMQDVSRIYHEQKTRRNKQKRGNPNGVD